MEFNKKKELSAELVQLEQKVASQLRKLERSLSCRPGLLGPRLAAMGYKLTGRSIEIVVNGGKREVVRATTLSGLGDDRERINWIKRELEQG